ncbi:MAG: chromate resistance protein ChrB domain-containing protein [Thermodesulfovibrionales bacterium]
MLQSKEIEKTGWLLFFYSVPSKPVSNRMRIWRKLTQAGALPFKGAVYILPHSEEHYEFCQWLVSEAVGMGGEADFVHVKRIEALDNREIIDLFNRQRERDYRDVEKRMEGIERKIQNIKKGGGIRSNKKILEQLNRLLKEFESVRKIDFFSSKTGNILKKRIETLRTELKTIEGHYRGVPTSAIVHKNIKDYQGKTWVTRKNPFVDRMASAWLIKRFIDHEASFEFIDDKKTAHLGEDKIAFDIMGGEFTHTGDMCTFEVLIKSFSLTDKRLKRIATIVHEIDIKDEKFRTPEAKGIEVILAGIRKTSKSDADALKKGIDIFEMLYESKGLF